MYFSFEILNNFIRNLFPYLGYEKNMVLLAVLNVCTGVSGLSFGILLWKSRVNLRYGTIVSSLIIIDGITRATIVLLIISPIIWLTSYFFQGLMFFSLINIKSLWGGLFSEK